MASAPRNLGPVLPPRGEIHAAARELRTLATRAMEFSSPGANADLQLALKQFAAMRAVLGTGEAQEGQGEQA